MFLSLSRCSLIMYWVHDNFVLIILLMKHENCFLYQPKKWPKLSAPGPVRLPRRIALPVNKTYKTGKRFCYIFNLSVHSLTIPPLPPHNSHLITLFLWWPSCRASEYLHCISWLVSEAQWAVIGWYRHVTLSPSALIGPVRITQNKRTNFFLNAT